METQKWQNLILVIDCSSIPRWGSRDFKNQAFGTETHQQSLQKPRLSTHSLVVQSCPVWSHTSRSVRSLIHSPVPSISVMRLRNGRLQNASHRLCVTPFVLFWNFSGQISWSPLKIVVLISSEWIAATPLTVWLATTARYAMRTNLAVQ